MLQQMAQSIITPTAQAVSCEVAGETVILDVASGQYFALDEVGSAIWRHLKDPCTVAELCARLMQEYDVAAERCEAEVSALIEQLEQHGLVRISS